MKLTPTLFALLFLLVLSSCNSDDENSGNNPDTSVVLLKRSIETFYDDNETIVSDYEYDGNKITKITFSNKTYYPKGSYEIYHYTNNLLTSTEFFVANELFETKTFEYNSQGKLSGYISKTPEDEDTAYKTTYTYNNDGTISIKKYTMYIDGVNSFEEIDATGILTLSNGNIIRSELNYETGESEIKNFTFDNSSSPFKNVFTNEVSMLIALEGGVNNILTYNEALNNEEQLNAVVSIQYNQSDYPVIETETGVKREFIYY